MIAVVQRVASASVTVDGERIASMGHGLLVLLGVAREDGEKDARYLASKVAGLRIFEDADEKMNLSLLETGGEMLVVSQFTLLGDCRRGRRPSFAQAAAPEIAESLYLEFVKSAREQGVRVQTGKFRTMMDVALVNQGPVTLIVESKND